MRNDNGHAYARRLAHHLGTVMSPCVNKNPTANASSLTGEHIQVSQRRLLTVNETGASCARLPPFASGRKHNADSESAYGVGS